MFSLFMVIVGTVIGSGFLSGKEIVVYFSRFGWWSYICILFAGFLFFLMFLLFLFKGESALQKLKSLPFCNVLNISICIILSSAMFASVRALTSSNIALQIVGMSLTLFLALKVVLRGQSTLSRLNEILVPIMLIALFFNLGYIAKLDFSFTFSRPQAPLTGIFFAVLYVAINCANSSIVISRLGKNLSGKQKVRIALIASTALTAILFFSNFVLLQNVEIFSSEMPLAQLTGNGGRLIMSIILILGSLTTLLSLVWTISWSMPSKRKGIMLGVILPYIFSFVGFGALVQYLYPLSSVFGLLLIGTLYGCWSPKGGMRP